MAVALVNHLVAPDDPEVFFDFASEMERLIRMAERQAFGPSTQALIDEAVSRDIPFIRLDRHSLVQFGHGVHQQRIRATMTSETSSIAVMEAMAAGTPVISTPVGIRVAFIFAMAMVPLTGSFLDFTTQLVLILALLFGFNLSRGISSAGWRW